MISGIDFTIASFSFIVTVESNNARTTISCNKCFFKLHGCSIPLGAQCLEELKSVGWSTWCQRFLSPCLQVNLIHFFDAVIVHAVRSANKFRKSHLQYVEHFIIQRAWCIAPWPLEMYPSISQPRYKMKSSMNSRKSIQRDPFVSCGEANFRMLSLSTSSWCNWYSQQKLTLTVKGRNQDRKAIDVLSWTYRQLPPQWTTNGAPCVNQTLSLYLTLVGSDEVHVAI